MKNQKVENAVLKLMNESTLMKCYIYFGDVLNAHDIYDVETLKNALEEHINETEIIYYETAMEFLAENDASLINSLELASDMGYSIENLSSETLATLLLQDLLIEELHNIL